MWLCNFLKLPFNILYRRQFNSRLLPKCGFKFISETKWNGGRTLTSMVQQTRVCPCAKMTNLICTSCLALVCLPSRRFSCIFLFGQCNKKGEITKSWPNASWSSTQYKKDSQSGCQKHCRCSGPPKLVEGISGKTVGRRTEEGANCVFICKSVWDSPLYCRGVYF